MLNKTCKEFVEVLASKEPVPGGGGASAYVASLGMALGSMVGNLTLGKKKYAGVQEDIQMLLNKSSDLINKLNELVNADAEAFKPLAAAYKLPTGTEEEKKIKNEVIQEALIQAAQSPLNIAEACVEAIELHKEFADKGTVMALSDAGCGAVFCKAALLGARLNVLINLGLMENKELKEKMQSKIDSLTEKGCSLADEIYAHVEKNL